MINKLHLKGTKLILYAIIYGFTQDGASEFTGSIQYLADFTGVSYESVRTNLKELTEQGLLIKIQGEAGFSNRYKAVCDEGYINTTEIVKKPSNAEKTQDKGKNQAVIDYLNSKAGTKFRYSAEAMKHISARFAEGFTEDDFRTVIDNKCEDWLKSDKMRPYLRPQTLFGTKFESYLNQKTKKTKADSSYDLDKYIDKDIHQKLVYRR